MLLYKVHIFGKYSPKKISQNLNNKYDLNRLKKDCNDFSSNKTKFNLKACAERLGITVIRQRQHGAEYDALIAGKIFINIMNNLKNTKPDNINNSNIRFKIESSNSRIRSNEFELIYELGR